jgi:hypothetical protein
MTTLKRRLADLEYSERLHFDNMAAQAQREFRLPLPDGTDVAVPLEMWAKIRELPSGSPESLALVEDFRNWVLAQHERHAKHDQA